MPQVNLFDGFEIDVPNRSVKDILKTISQTSDKPKTTQMSIIDKINFISDKVNEILGKQRNRTVVIKTKEEFEKYVTAAIASGLVAVDTETNNSLDPLTCKLMGLCLHYPNGKQAYIPVNHVNPTTEDRLEWQMTEFDCAEQLRRIVESGVFIVMHNGKFDYEVLKCTCKVEVIPNWDTMIGARLLDENELAGLKNQYITKIDPSQQKYDIEHLFENILYQYVPPEVFALYAATDSMMTTALYQYQKPIFEDPNNTRLYWLFKNIEMPIVIVTAEMELKGVHIDLDYCLKLQDKYAKLIEEVNQEISKEIDTNIAPRIREWLFSADAAEHTILYMPKKSKLSKLELYDSYPKIDDEGRRYKLGKTKAEVLTNNPSAKTIADVMVFSDKINIGSPQQLAILLYDVMRCPCVNTSSPRAVGEDELTELAEKTELNICKLIVKKRGLEKLLSTYLKVIPELTKHWPDGRVRIHFSSCGTDTGRYSSGGDWKFPLPNGKIKKLSGLNGQNIPSHSPDIRACFAADTNYTVIHSLNTNWFEVEEYREVKSGNGWKYCRDLTPGDYLICGNESLEITDIKLSGITHYLQFKALSQKDYELELRTRYKIVGSDYSAQEPRLTAFMSQSPEMLKAYEEGKDLYCVIAQSIFDNDYEDNKEFYPEGKEVEIDGKIMVSGSGQEYVKSCSQSQAITIPWFYLVKTSIGEQTVKNITVGTVLLGNDGTQTKVLTVTNDNKEVTFTSEAEVELTVKSPERLLNKEGKARRSAGKTLLLAMLYGMSPATAGARMGKSAAEGKQLFDTFFKKFPEVKQLITDSKTMLKTKGYVEDWCGRRRRLPDYFLPPYTVSYKNKAKQDALTFNPILGCDDRVYLDANLTEVMKSTKLIRNNSDYEKQAKAALARKEPIILTANTGRIAQAERQCLNARIQGGAASLTKLAMVNIYNDEELRRCKAQLIITVHDEVLVECPEYYAADVEKRLPEVMIDTAKPYINVPMKCDPYNVTHWYIPELSVSIQSEFEKLLKKYSHDEAFKKLCEAHIELTEEQLKHVAIDGQDLGFDAA